MRASSIYIMPQAIRDETSLVPGCPDLNQSNGCTELGHFLALLRVPTMQYRIFYLKPPIFIKKIWPYTSDWFIIITRALQNDYIQTAKVK